MMDKLLKKSDIKPRDLLEAAKRFYDAYLAIGAAMQLLNGHVRGAVIDDYGMLYQCLFSRSLALEDDFARRCAAVFGVEPRMVPLFGSPENLARADAFLREHGA
jgi:hypothetical protein